MRLIRPGTRADPPLRRGVAAAIVATLIVEAAALLFGWSSLLFLSPLEPILGAGAIILGLAFRSLVAGFLFALVEPWLPRRALLKGLVFALGTACLIALLGALAGAGDAARFLAAPLGAILPIAAYGLILGGVFWLFSPEEWRPPYEAAAPRN